MARALPGTPRLRLPRIDKVGRQLAEILTAGMYSDPLMVLREYVQNAVDSIDQARATGRLAVDEGTVEITVDGLARRIEVLDNGAGVPNDRVEGVLCGLGVSTKTSGSERGFRGIGRLGGLGYCDCLRFESRSAGREQVAEVIWDAGQLRRAVKRQSGEGELRSCVRSVQRLRFRKATRRDPAHFFRVVMEGVNRFHRDELMDVAAVASYLSHVAPVGFCYQAFPFAGEIEQHLAGVDGYRSYAIGVNGKAVLKPYAAEVPIRSCHLDRIRGVELFELQGPSGRSVGRGWYAKTSYLASVPARVPMRGVRVRQGNLEVGDEYFLADAYAERRFSTWHIGEIHVGYSLTPNARRDGFEHSPDLEAFLEQAQLLGRHLSYLCRASSKSRSTSLRVGRDLERAEGLLRRTFVIDEQHAEEICNRVTAVLDKIADTNGGTAESTQGSARVARVRRRLNRLCAHPPYLHDALDGRALRFLSKREILEEVARGMIENMEITGTAEELVARVMHPYLKSRRTKSARGG
jgi:hypothetical protein